MKKVWILSFLLIISFVARAEEVTVSLGSLGVSGFEATEQKRFNLEGVAFNWAIADLGNDGVEEIVVAAVKDNGESHLSVLRQDSTKISDFVPFPKNRNVVDFCLGRGEILVATKNTPYLAATFKPDGQKIKDFTLPKKSQGPAQVACHTSGEQIFYVETIGKIITVLNHNKLKLMAPDAVGSLKSVSLDLGTDERAELVAVDEAQNAFVWDNGLAFLKKVKLPLSRFMADWPQPATFIQNGQRTWWWGTSPGQAAGLVSWSESSGEQTSQLDVWPRLGYQPLYQKSQNKLWLLPLRTFNATWANENQQIVVNLKNQMIFAYERGVPLMLTRVSTGIWNLPTPIGDFKVINKKSRAYSKKYGLYMPYWMMFDGRGYGLHELPEWPNGTKEGESHLGVPVSHGCIRLGVGPAQALYDWAVVGTNVKVVKE